MLFEKKKRSVVEQGTVLNRCRISFGRTSSHLRKTQASTRCDDIYGYDDDYGCFDCESPRRNTGKSRGKQAVVVSEPAVTRVKREQVLDGGRGRDEWYNEKADKSFTVMAEHRHRP